MGTLEDIKTMQQQGMSEQDIVAELQTRGVPQDEIYNSMAQAKIKEAVTDQEPKGLPPAPPTPTPETAGAPPTGLPPEGPVTQEAGMPPGAPAGAPPTAPPEAGAPPTEAPADIYAAAPGGATEYAYAPPTGGLSTDTITEIAEQVITERLTPIRDQLESILDLRTTIESKVESLSERLKRIEKTIDRLQLSLLQKVGEYVTNVEDIKREMVETQKSFKTLLPRHKKAEHPAKKPKHKKS